MKHTAIGLFLAAAMLLSLAACSGGTPAPAPDAGSSAATPAPAGGTDAPAGQFDIGAVDTSDWIQLDLSYATYLPAENPNVNLCFTSYQQKLDELMPGWVTLTIYPSGTLLSQADILEGVKSGVADLGMVDVSSVKELLPVTAMWSCPSTHVGSTASASAALQEWYEILQPEEYDGVVVLHMQANASGQLLTNFDWEDVSQVSGKQIRATAALADTVTALGATPVSIDTSELYEASRSGLIDGAYYTITAAYLQGAHEFLKYGTFMDMGATAYAYVMNQDVFEQMPESQQVFFMEAFRQAFWELIIPQIPVVMDIYEPCLQAIEDGDLKVKALSDETYEEMFAATAGIRADYIAMLESRGYSNAQEAADLLDQMVEKWNNWYPISKYQEGFFEAAAGRKDEYMAGLADFHVDPSPEITNYIPLADRAG